MEPCPKNSGNGEAVMTEDTKFPESIKDYTSNDGLLTEFVETEDIQDWFKRCMDDRPNPDDYDASAWDDFMLFEERWYVKWFGQFKEYNLGVDYAKPNIDYSVMPFGNRECSKCGGCLLYTSPSPRDRS